MEIGSGNVLSRAGAQGDLAQKQQGDTPGGSPGDTISLCPAESAITPDMKKLKLMAEATGQAADESTAVLRILIPHAKDVKEAERELAWLRANIKPGADLKEMAEFYVIGKGRYAPDNPKREELMKASLEDIQGYLERREGKEREDFSEGLRILCREVPQQRSEYVFHSYALDILHGAQEIIADKTPTTNNGFNFGANQNFHNVPFTPPPADKEYSLTDAAKLCADFYSEYSKCRYREPEVLPDGENCTSNWSRNVVYMTFKVYRGFLGNDEGKKAEMRDLFRVTGDAWSSLGLMISLEIDHPEIRNELKTLILDSLPPAMDIARNELADITQTYTFLSQNLRPGDDIKGFVQGVKDLIIDLRRSLVKNCRGWEMKTYDKKMLDQIDGIRGNTLSAMEALEQYKTRCASLTDDQKSNMSTIVDLFEYTKENGEGLQKAISGATGLEDVNREVTDILSNGWIKRGFPGQDIKAALTMGYTQRKPEETLRESCERLFNDYALLGDLRGREKLNEMIEKGVKKGDFPGKGVDEVKDELDRQIRFKRIMGRSSRSAINEAYDELNQNCRHNQDHQYDDTHTVKVVDDDFVSIGGLMLPRRK